MTPSFEKGSDIDAQFREQFEKTAKARWGERWMDDVDPSVVEEYQALLGKRTLSPEDMVHELFKAVRFDDKIYYRALALFVLEGSPVQADSYAELRQRMMEAEEIPRPNLAEVFKHVEETLAHEEVTIPSSLSEVESISRAEVEAIGSASDGDLGELLLEYLGGLKRSSVKGETEKFFKDFPTFWYQYFIAKEKLGK